MAVKLENVSVKDDEKIVTFEAMMRFYDTPFYAKLEDESTKLWTYSPQQLYYLFHNAA